MITLRPCIHRTTPLYLRLPSFSICLGRVQLTPVFCFIALGCLAVLRLGLDVSFAHIAFRLTHSLTPCFSALALPRAKVAAYSHMRACPVPSTTQACFRMNLH